MSAQDREPSILNTPPYCEPRKEQYVDLRAIEASGEGVEKDGNSSLHKARERCLRRRWVRREPERASRARELEIEKLEVPSSGRSDDEGNACRSGGARHLSLNEARLPSCSKENNARQPSSCRASGMNDGGRLSRGEASATSATSGANESSDVRQARSGEMSATRGEASTASATGRANEPSDTRQP